MYVCILLYFYYAFTHILLLYLLYIFYSFDLDSLTSYCVILNDFNIKFNTNLLRMYVFNS